MNTYRQTSYFKTLAMTFFFVAFLVSNISAQHLHIKTTKNGKVRALKAGQKMQAKLSELDVFTKYKIQSFTDSSMVLIMLDEEEIMLRTINLKEIYSIKKTSGMHKIAQVGGTFLMLGGAVAIFEAPSIAGDEGSDWLVRGAGVVMVAVGLIPYLIKPTEYVQGKNAEYSIAK